MRKHLYLQKIYKWVNFNMENVTLLLFSTVLISCIATGMPILYALITGYFIFCIYAIIKRYRISQIIKMSFAGIYTVKNILITFILIGMLTALWRAAGTIPTIVCYAANFITPSIFILMAFLLNCLVSFLTGTAFGTAATMGVICMTMSITLGISTTIVGGAILSGVYFGDRCSPVSTSALLIAELTGTNIFKNISNMMKISAIPFGLTCVTYAVIGIVIPHNLGDSINIKNLFSGSFKLGWVALTPALIIIVLSLFRVNVKLSMLSSIISAIVVCALYQHLDLSNIIKLIVMGYHSPNFKIAAMINGGGIVSMLRVTAIICLSSSYAGIFKGTGLLDKLKERIVSFSKRSSAYSVILGTSIVAGIIACNQTLTIMLTHQTCDTVENDQEQFAIDLEDTAVVVAPLIPWSIASAVPLTAISAPVSSLLVACYLYLLPLWRLAMQVTKQKRGHKLDETHHNQAQDK